MIKPKFETVPRRRDDGVDLRLELLLEVARPRHAGDLVRLVRVDDLPEGLDDVYRELV